MFKKTILALFLTLILLGSFGVKKSWGVPSSTSCCSSGTYLPPPIGMCSDSAGKLSETVCAVPPNNGTCVKNFINKWVCDFALAPTPTNTPTPAPVTKCCNFWQYDSNAKDCVSPVGVHKSTNCNGFSCVPKNGDYYCDFSASVSTTTSPFDPCKNLTGTDTAGVQGECRSCTGINATGQFNITVSCDTTKYGPSCGTWTSLGCIPNDPPNLVGWIITLASGVAGGIAFLLILFGSFQIVTSGGVPEKIAGGKDIITSALLGLLFIFLSVLILKVIGVQILGIPGWT